MRRQRRRGYTWPKTHRLKKRREFLLVQRQAAKHPTADLVILWMPARAPSTRLGITVSRKVAKQAVRRNRIKRWIRESFRRLDLDRGPPLDVAVIARPLALKTSFAAIQQQLEEFWDRVAPGAPPASPG